MTKSEYKAVLNIKKLCNDIHEPYYRYAKAKQSIMKTLEDDFNKKYCSRKVYHISRNNTIYPTEIIQYDITIYGCKVKTGFGYGYYFDETLILLPEIN